MSQQSDSAAPVRVVDSHVHLWDRDEVSFPWMDRMEGTEGMDEVEADRDEAAASGTVADPGDDQEPETPDAFAHRVLPADLPPAPGFDRSVVLVEVDAAGADALTEARWFSRLHETTPEVAGFVANLPVAGDVAGLLAQYSRLPGWVGVRHLLQDEPDEAFMAPETDAALFRVAAAGKPFDLCLRHHQLPLAVGLVRRHPELVFVLDHLGKPPLARGDLEAWARDLAALAELPQVNVKLSGLTAELAGMPLEQAVPMLRWCVAEAALLFGPERCMVGSDWPVSPLLDDQAARWFELVGECFDDTDAVFTETAARVYGLRS